jgi:hypothetical protein
MAKELSPCSFSLWYLVLDPLLALLIHMKQLDNQCGSSKIHARAEMSHLILINFNREQIIIIIIIIINNTPGAFFKLHNFEEHVDSLQMLGNFQSACGFKPACLSIFCYSEDGLIPSRTRPGGIELVGPLRFKKKVLQLLMLVNH